MDKPDPQATDALRHDLETSWHRFLDLYEPLRPELYRYCRHLTRSPWDADDLVQDAPSSSFRSAATATGTGRRPEHMCVMALMLAAAGYAPVNGLQLYYEIRGK